ncbi:hypothetical protein Zm00014a_028690 [Zea mays]|uniref:Uncharacterized protein n=1 Tax=Zea mays TaxID=4577 RepID=A0A3L6FYK9_MAIZE|nr:hypothetical protein Zm00014a_028690 [Zea mays]
MQIYLVCREYGRVRSGSGPHLVRQCFFLCSWTNLEFLRSSSVKLAVIFVMMNPVMAKPVRKGQLRFHSRRKKTGHGSNVFISSASALLEISYLRSSASAFASGEKWMGGEWNLSVRAGAASVRARLGGGRGTGR